MTKDTLKITAAYQRDQTRHSSYELKVKLEGELTASFDPKGFIHEPEALDQVRHMAARLYHDVFRACAERVAGVHGYSWGERPPLALVEEQLEGERKRADAAERRALIAETQRDELRRAVAPPINAAMAPGFGQPYRTGLPPGLSGGVATSASDVLAEHSGCGYRP
jgi:hypothetical protein